MLSTFKIISFMNLVLFISLFSQNQQVLVLDDIEMYPLNQVGGQIVSFDSNASIIINIKTGDEAFDRKGKSIGLDFNVANSNSYCGIASNLGGINLENYNYLSFWIRGTSGLEYIRVQLKNATAQSSVAVWDYLDGGPTTAWQKVVIPLDAFYNLTSLSFLTELVFIFENFQSSINGSPLSSEVCIDDIIVGSYFPGYIKIDHFDDLLKSNAVGGNIGEFSNPPSATSYTSEINCDTFNLKPCALEVHYNNVDVAMFGGEFIILGGGLTGWDPTYKNLSAYDSLHFSVKAAADSLNPGNFKIELKTPSQTHNKRIFNITSDFKNYSIGFNEFSPPITIPEIGEMTVVFERNLQENQIGIVFLDEIEFRDNFYSGADTTSPFKPIDWLYNGNAISNSIEIMDNDELSITFANLNSRLESVRLEYRGDNQNSWQVYERIYVDNNNTITWTLEKSRFPENHILDLKAIAQNHNGKEDTSDIIYLKTAPFNFTLTELFSQSFEVFQLQRNGKGIYRDALRFDGNHFHPSSVANIGMGLVSLCIADAMGWINNAAQLTETTLQSITGNSPNYFPDRNASGFYRHFIDMETGAQAWDSEYSSIDTGILVAGSLFCKNYFSSNTNIAFYTDQLWTSIDWLQVIANPQAGEIYRELNADGTGKPGTITKPFNEYMIVAWLAFLAEQTPGPATELWNRFYADPTVNEVPKSYFEGIELLTDVPGAFLPHFTLQFPYYLCHHFTTNQNYLNYMSNARKADSLWWSQKGIAMDYEWGLGAGSANFGFGYHADAIDNNPACIFSPHIISGFIPVYEEGKDDLLQLLSYGKSVYGLPSGSPEKVLWRQSLNDPCWQAEDIQGVDFSTMLFGLATLPNHLGPNFFSTYNDFDSIIVSIDNDYDKNVSEFRLSQNYPNPFNPSTRIEFTLPRPVHVTLAIYNIKGEKVITLIKQKFNTGSHFVDWEGIDESGTKVSSGVYLYHLQTENGISDTKKLILLK